MNLYARQINFKKSLKKENNKKLMLAECETMSENNNKNFIFFDLFK